MYSHVLDRCLFHASGKENGLAAQAPQKIKQSCLKLYYKIIGGDLPADLPANMFFVLVETKNKNATKLSWAVNYVINASAIRVASDCI